MAKSATHGRQIELLDGPLKGTCHELAGKWKCPDRLSIRDEYYQAKIHWYVVNVREGTAKYQHTKYE